MNILVDKLEISNMTRAEKVKEHYEKHPFSTYYEYRNGNGVDWVYWINEQGDWVERKFDKCNKIFIYVYFLLTRKNGFMNIITCK